MRAIVKTSKILQTLNDHLGFSQFTLSNSFRTALILYSCFTLVLKIFLRIIIRENALKFIVSVVTNCCHP